MDPGDLVMLVFAICAILSTPLVALCIWLDQRRSKKEETTPTFEQIEEDEVDDPLNLEGTGSPTCHP